MTVVPTDEKYEKLWCKIRDLIRSIINDSDNYNEKYMKNKLNSDDDLPMKKTLEFFKIIDLLDLFFMRLTNTIHKLS